MQKPNSNRAQVFSVAVMLLFTSCMFRITRKTIRTKTMAAAATVQLISEDSVLLRFDRAAYFAFLKTDSSSRAEAEHLERLFTADNSSIDSICAQMTDRNLFFSSADFIVMQLDAGKAALTNLHTGKPIKRYKRKTSYVNPGLFRKGDLHWRSYHAADTDKEIYFRRYRTIHF